MKKRLSEQADGKACPLPDRVSGTGQSRAASSPDSRNILLVDDNPDVARAVEIAFRMAGHRLHRAAGAEEAHSLLARRRFDAVILDLNFSRGRSDGSEGLACLARIMADDPAACVVVLTAHGGIRTAVAAMQAGARDFAVKPWSNADLIAKVEAAVARRPAGGAPPQGSPPEAEPVPRLLGESAPMLALRDLVRRVGPTAAGVAITGPSGSGRTLAALALHAASAHAAERPLRIDLRDRAAWDQLVGANGSVVLRHPDRLGEVEQEQLLAAIPDSARTIAIAGSMAPVVPALMRRIAVVEIAVPPLAARGEDVVLLARHFLRRAAERFGRAEPVLGPAALAAIRAAVWTDEVRGLALAMERALLLTEGDAVDAALLSAARPTTQPAAATAADPGERAFDLERTEKALIESALREHGHNISHAARALGLSRAALYRRMERHGL
jgi:DNA-binding NtrC family response regulator